MGQEEGVACSVRGALYGLLLLLAACGSTDWKPPDDGEFGTLPPEEQARLRERAEGRAAAPRALARARLASEDYQTLVQRGSTTIGDMIALAEISAWIAQRSPDEAERTERSKIGIWSTAKALAQRDDSAPAHYYRAVCLGLFARDNTGGALENVKEMARHARRVVALDPDFDHAGGHRYLCRLLAQAPGWPTSIGDLEAAVVHGEQAIDRAPDHPENHLALADAFRRDDEPEAARRHAQISLDKLELGSWDLQDEWRKEAQEILRETAD